jgi:hypothetical protein
MFIDAPEVEGATDESRVRAASRHRSAKLTEKQGQDLAFIHAYTLVLGRPPAEADLQATSASRHPHSSWTVLLEKMW